MLQLRSIAAVPLVLALIPAAAAAQGGRRQQGQVPTLPPPTILEYQPRSTLVVPAHPVPARSTRSWTSTGTRRGSSARK
jgi:hypothetical protein